MDMISKADQYSKRECSKWEGKHSNKVKGLPWKSAREWKNQHRSESKLLSEKEEQLTQFQVCSGLTGIWIYQFLKQALELAKNEK